MKKMTKFKRLQLLQEAKELGMKSIEIDGVKYELPSTTYVEQKPISEEESKALLKALTSNPLDELSEDEVLYYATPYYDELQTQKKLKQQQEQDKGALNG